MSGGVARAGSCSSQNRLCFDGGRGEMVQVSSESGVLIFGMCSGIGKLSLASLAAWLDLEML